MFSPARPPSVHPASICRSFAPWFWFATVIVLLLGCSPVRAQQAPPPATRLEGVLPGGGRTSVTESWGTFDLRLSNWSDTDRLARVVVFYDGQTDKQYGRDVWVPARSTLLTWMLVGPAAPQILTKSREIQILFYDRSEGKDHLVLPHTEERIRGRGVLYRKREPFTAILLDEEPPEKSPFGRLPEPDSAADEAYRLARTFRAARGLSAHVQILNPGPLPPTAETFDGVDHFLLASDRMARDLAGSEALRHWLQQGGKLWVMLDLVAPELVAPLLGDALDFQVVDRVSLTDFELRSQADGAGQEDVEAEHHERPVNLVRVLLPANERAPHTVRSIGSHGHRGAKNPAGQAWPAWFTRKVGRGTVVLTTLGPRGWCRPRGPGDPPSPFRIDSNLPVPLEPLVSLAEAVHPPEREPGFAVELMRQPLMEQIGYAVIGPGTVAGIFVAALLVAVALGFALRKSQRPELLGWLGPAVALGAAGTFLAIGEWSAQPAAEVAVGQVVYAVPGTEEAPCQGLLAWYRPGSGPVQVGVEQGGRLDLDMAGLEGQTRRLILTDMDAWHWENLAMPAGVRFGPFRYTARTSEPITAVGRIGPGGLKGKLTAGPFRKLGDALLTTPGGRNLAVHVQPDGTFEAAGTDTLQADQFVAGAVLTDRQQRRQQLYREYLKPQGPRLQRPQQGNVLLAWADPVDMHFMPAPGRPPLGAALLVMPVRLEPSAPGTTVTIPAPLVACQRIVDGRPRAVPRESSLAVNMRLRFQLPPAVLPLKVARARLAVKISAPTRRVTISGAGKGGPGVLREVDSPLDPVLVDIADHRFLEVDGEGGLQLDLAVSAPPAAPRLPRAQRATQGPGPWRIEYLELEVTGRTDG
jgi:hypothetical protein